jgi:branched-chain amino acid aminotransferase
MHPFVLYNNRIVAAEEVIFSAGQVGLLSGWGVFSTLKIHRGVPFALERHWARLTRDAELIHVELPIDLEGVRQGFGQLVIRNEALEATARLCIFRSRGGRWESPNPGPASDWVILSDDLAPWPESVALQVRENGRHAASPFVGAKTLSWAANLTMYEDAQRAGFAEVILLNERREVAECTSANIFAVIDGVTCTPPLSSGLLPGVTREVMLSELAPELRIKERVLSVDDLLAADEVFITSSTRELLPVERIGDSPLDAATTSAWPRMEELREGLREYLRRYTEDQLASRL